MTHRLICVHCSTVKWSTNGCTRSAENRWKKGILWVENYCAFVMLSAQTGRWMHTHEVSSYPTPLCSYMPSITCDSISITSSYTAFDWDHPWKITTMVNLWVSFPDPNPCVWKGLIRIIWGVSWLCIRMVLAKQVIVISSHLVSNFILMHVHDV